MHENMKLVFKQGMEMEHYVANASVVDCFDHRTFASLVGYDKDHGIIDPLIHAGGAKNLASPAKDFYREYVLDQLELSVTLHKPQKIVLMNHYNCGAYGGSEPFDNDRKKEEEFHKEELRKAEAVVRQKFPDIPVEKMYLDDDGLWLIE